MTLLFFPFQGVSLCNFSLFLSAFFLLHWGLFLCRLSPTLGFDSLPSFPNTGFCLYAVFPLHWVLSFCRFSPIVTLGFDFLPNTGFCLFAVFPQYWVCLYAFFPLQWVLCLCRLSLILGFVSMLSYLFYFLFIKTMHHN